MRTLAPLLAIAACAHLQPLGAALPTDTWVDPVAGDDANSGSSPNDALRTLTRALQNTVGSVPSDNIWLLPGTFSSASGEVFPIQVTQGEAAIRSTDGPGTTLFDVGGASVGIRFDVSTATVSHVRLNGVSVRDASLAGIHLDVDQTAGQVTLESVRIRDCWSGIELATSGFLSTPILIRDARVEQCVDGLRGILDSFLASELIVRDSRFEACTNNGILVRAEPDSIAEPTLERVRILRCAAGIRFVNVSLSSPEQLLRLSDCLIAKHQVGIEADAQVRLDVTSSTVAANTTFGISAAGPLGTIDGSVVWGNGADLEPALGWTITRSDVGTSGYAPADGNVSVDPLFRDANAEDFRLGSGTDCIDRGTPLVASVDLDGNPRDVDGDLDLVGSPDMGALELQVLDGSKVARPGDLLSIEIHGEDHNFARLVYDPMGLLQAPLSTSFGVLWIDPMALLEGGVIGTTSGAPSTLAFPLPADPALVGLTFGWQAFVRSSNSSSTAGLSNPIETLIVD